MSQELLQLIDNNIISLTCSAEIAVIKEGLYKCLERRKEFGDEVLLQIL